MGEEKTKKRKKTHREKRARGVGEIKKDTRVGRTGDNEGSEWHRPRTWH